jgi:hypothetical protein
VSKDAQTLTSVAALGLLQAYSEYREAPDPASVLALPGIEVPA